MHFPSDFDPLKHYIFPSFRPPPRGFHPPGPPARGHPPCNPHWGQNNSNSAMSDGLGSAPEVGYSPPQQGPVRAGLRWAKFKGIRAPLPPAEPSEKCSVSPQWSTERSRLGDDSDQMRCSPLTAYPCDPAATCRQVEPLSTHCKQPDSVLAVLGMHL